MARCFTQVLAALAVALGFCGTAWAARGELIPETTLAQSGLTRSWFMQVQLDASRTKVTSMTLREGVLYAQTDAAMVHAIDAETGKTLWSRQVGKPGNPAMGLDARDNRVAVVSGSTLYILDRATGDMLSEKSIKHAPGAGPAVSTKRVYVPGIDGMVMAQQLPTASDAASVAVAEKKAQSDPDKQPLYCQSLGRALVQPLVIRDYVGGEYIVWPTDKGYLNFGRVERDAENVLALKYRLETGAPILVQPAYLPRDPTVLGDAGIVFAASCDGFLYAVSEETGETLWRFSTGDPILLSPAVVDTRVYLTTELGALYCLATKSGKNLWSSENVKQFVAAGKKRLYVTDGIGNLQVLNAKTGTRLDSLPTEKVAIKMANTDTDRIYLVSDSGLIQCLHEIEQTEPLLHGKDRKEAARAEAKQIIEEKPVERRPVVASDTPRPAATPRAATPPRERPAKKERPKPTPRNRKGASGNNPGTPPGGPGGPGMPGKPPRGTKPNHPGG